MKKAFTLIELVVAIGILGMMFLFAGVIFKTSIEAYRTAGANAEIMQKLRAITDQLNRDFKGLRKDAPLLICFFQDKTNPNQRYDQIMFFADGGFQSTQLYDKPVALTYKIPSTTGTPVVGNVCRISYSQAQSRDSRDNDMKKPWHLLDKDRILARRQHILTADPDLDRWPDPANVGVSFGDDYGADTGYNKNELYEHDSLSLAQWKTLDRNAYGAMGGTIMKTCFRFRPWIDMQAADTFHKLMCAGVDSFAIQWAYWHSDVGFGEFRWFPSDDPDGDGVNMDSHFYLVPGGFPIPPSSPYADVDVFGAFFNIPTDDQINYWGPISLMRKNATDNFSLSFYPKALKFSFRLYDSRGILENGRKFTHIVYIGD